MTKLQTTLENSVKRQERLEKRRKHIQRQRMLYHVQRRWLFWISVIRAARIWGDALAAG